MHFLNLKSLNIAAHFFLPFLSVVFKTKLRLVFLMAKEASLLSLGHIWCC